MDVISEVTLPSAPAMVFNIVSDLSTYPRWLDIVPVAESEHGSSQPAWSVVLRAQVGPLARAKRLRMVRSQCEVPHSVRFERSETDGRRHSPWVLSAQITSDGQSECCHLRVQLHYGGSLWVPMLDRLLANEVERSKGRLADLIRQTQDPT